MTSLPKFSKVDVSKLEIDDDDVMHVLDENPPESQRAHVHAAVQACPVLALTLSD